MPPAHPSYPAPNTSSPCPPCPAACLGQAHRFSCRCASPIPYPQTTAPSRVRHVQQHAAGGPMVQPKPAAPTAAAPSTAPAPQHAAGGHTGKRTEGTSRCAHCFAVVMSTLHGLLYRAQYQPIAVMRPSCTCRQAPSAAAAAPAAVLLCSMPLTATSTRPILSTPQHQLPPPLLSRCSMPPAGPPATALRSLLRLCD